MSIDGRKRANLGGAMEPRLVSSCASSGLAGREGDGQDFKEEVLTCVNVPSSSLLDGDGW